MITWRVGKKVGVTKRKHPQIDVYTTGLKKICILKTTVAKPTTKMICKTGKSSRALRSKVHYKRSLNSVSAQQGF